MEHAVKAEFTLNGDTARLYEIVFEATRESVSPGTVNRAMFQTGLVHHALMLLALGALPEKDREAARALIESIGATTIMKDGFDQAREYWKRATEAGLHAQGDADG